MDAVTDFKQVYAEWAYRKAEGEDASRYAWLVFNIWGKLDAMDREGVRAEILADPLIVGTQFVIGPDRTKPLYIRVTKWALPTEREAQAFFEHLYEAAE